MSYGGQGGYGGGGYAPPGGAPPGYGGAAGGYAPPGGAPPPGGGGYHGGGYGSQTSHPGGFAPRVSQGPPPGADPQLWNWFTSVDTDRSGQISVHELQKALINGDWSPFDLDTVKMLMNIFDTDRSGTIGFNEFAGLWKYIQDWQHVFKHFDRDRSNSIDRQELQSALRQFGYNLPPHTLNLVEKKYDTTEGSNTGGPQDGITFDRFVRACVAIKQLTESFQRLDTQRSGWVQLNYEQFMDTVLRLP